MNKLLCVYNTCGIHKKDNFNHYCKCIDSILNQKFDNFTLIVSDCLGLSEVRQKLVSKYMYDSRVKFNFIDDILPVNCTFNLSVLDGIEAFGKFEGYFFIDSGVNFEEDMEIFKKSYELFKKTNAGMLHLWSDDDNGLYVGGWGIDWLKSNKDYIVVPIGKACNLHCQIFSHDLIEFYNRPFCDIFSAHCSESTFSFICAAIKKQWIISKNIKVSHIKGIDGASAGFSHPSSNIQPWEHLFRSPRSARELISDPVAIAAGFGYEECQNVLMHDVNQFDENGHCVNEVLKHWIKDNLFLPISSLDYNSINRKFII